MTRHAARAPAAAALALVRFAAFILTSLAGVILVPLAARAASVTVPMRLDHDFLERLIIAQAYTAPGEEAELWHDAHGCGYLTLREPKVDSVQDRLRVRSRGDARWGPALGDTCVLPLSWNGSIELFMEPTLDPKLPIVHFRVVDSNVYGKEGRKSRFTSRLWDWMKNYAHQRMENVSVDLHRPLEEVRGLLPLVLPADYASGADVTLASVTLADSHVEQTGLVIDVSLATPDRSAGTPAPEPPLDVKEIEQWDAFLTFVIKHAALEVPDHSLRTALLGVLLDARYDIVEVLMAAEPGDRDPVPDLFRKAWTRLAPVLRRLDDSLPGAAAIRYLAFIAAGDALLAVEKLGPETGLDISADGLRRLARVLAPDETADPLIYETAVDPALRESLGFGPPLPLPASPPPPELAGPGAPPSTLTGTSTTTIGPATTIPDTTTTTLRASHGANAIKLGTTTTSAPSPRRTTTTVSPPRRTTTTAPARTEPTTTRPQPTTTKPQQTTTTSPVRSHPTTTKPAPTTSPLSRLLQWLLPSAYAGDMPIEELRARMRKGWAPARAELNYYLPFIRRMLVEAATESLSKKPVPAPYTPLFEPLVLATAWKETCWRHYVRRAGKIVPIESRVGAIGIMQVNPRVWRGFYQVASLRADAAYNARAGSEIVQHYLVDYAIRKKEHEKGGGMDALARATYAAYNGGPGHLARYRNPKAPKALRAIDAAFWRIYQAAKNGQEFDRKQCYGS